MYAKNIETKGGREKKERDRERIIQIYFHFSAWFLPKYSNPKDLRKKKSKKNLRRVGCISIITYHLILHLLFYVFHVTFGLGAKNYRPWTLCAFQCTNILWKVQTEFRAFFSVGTRKHSYGMLFRHNISGPNVVVYR